LVYLLGHYVLSAWATTWLTFVAALAALVVLHLGSLALLDFRSLRKSLSLLPDDATL